MYDTGLQTSSRRYPGLPWRPHDLLSWPPSPDQSGTVWVYRSQSPSCCWRLNVIILSRPKRPNWRSPDWMKLLSLSATSASPQGAMSTLIAWDLVCDKAPRCDIAGQSVVTSFPCLPPPFELPALRDGGSAEREENQGVLLLSIFHTRQSREKNKTCSRQSPVWYSLFPRCYFDRV